jgi:hypothetical protein
MSKKKRRNVLFVTLMTTVRVAATKMGTNDISDGHHWCPNLSTSFFFFVFFL